jgi:hypothetical protein
VCVHFACCVCECTYERASVCACCSCLCSCEQVRAHVLVLVRASACRVRVFLCECMKPGHAGTAANVQRITAMQPKPDCACMCACVCAWTWRTGEETPSPVVAASRPPILHGEERCVRVRASVHEPVHKRVQSNQQRGTRRHDSRVDVRHWGCLGGARRPCTPCTESAVESDRINNAVGPWTWGTGEESTPVLRAEG